jgi:hypothetical protein
MITPVTLDDTVWTDGFLANCLHCKYWDYGKDKKWGTCKRINVHRFGSDVDAEIICDYNAELETSSTFYCSLFEEM